MEFPCDQGLEQGFAPDLECAGPSRPGPYSPWGRGLLPGATTGRPDQAGNLWSADKGRRSADQGRFSNPEGASLVVPAQGKICAAQILETEPGVLTSIEDGRLQIGSQESEADKVAFVGR